MGLMGNAPQAPPVTMHAWVQNIVDGANAAIALLSPHWQRWAQSGALPSAEEIEDLVVSLESKLESTLSKAFDDLEAYLGVRAPDCLIPLLPPSLARSLHPSLCVVAPLRPLSGVHAC